MFISWMLLIPSFKKSLMVEQFQGNYLKFVIVLFIILLYISVPHQLMLFNIIVTMILRTRSTLQKLDGLLLKK